MPTPVYKFRNVQNNGIWPVGGTYTLEVWVWYPDLSPALPPLDILNAMRYVGGLEIGNKVLLPADYILPPEQPPYIFVELDETGTEGVEIVGLGEEGDYETGFWQEVQVHISEGTPLGGYKFVYRGLSGVNVGGYWVWSVYDYQTQYIEIALADSIPPPPDPIIPPVPEEDPEVVNDDLFWIPGHWDGDVYTPPTWGETPGNYVAAGGGRYNQNLVVAGRNLVYYEEFS
jgi:hypothetical protein